MEKAIVTFKNPDNEEKFVEISLNFLKEENAVDYDVKLGPTYSAKDPMDFITFLADMFINMLSSQGNGE